MVRPPVLRVSRAHAECVALLESDGDPLEPELLSVRCCSSEVLGDAVVAVRLASSKLAEDTSYVLLDEPR